MNARGSASVLYPVIPDSRGGIAEAHHICLATRFRAASSKRSMEQDIIGGFSSASTVAKKTGSLVSAGVCVSAPLRRCGDGPNETHHSQQRIKHRFSGNPVNQSL